MNAANTTDVDLMRRAIRLAMQDRGNVEPNPMVGCVIARGSHVIGEGYHAKYGGPHAEPNALATCTESPAGATAYVTLEPCCHTDKQTPPCVPRLIEAKIGRVVIGCLDPNPKVNGQGAAQLRAAGIAVEESPLSAAAKQLNAAMFKRLQQRRPYVTLKWAQSADGKIGVPGRRVMISNDASLAVVHQLRARSDAILVGINTVLSDDPKLTPRGPATSRKLLRIVLDTKLRMPMTSQLVRTIDQGPVLVYCDETAYRSQSSTVAELKSHGVEIVPLRTESDGRLSLSQMLDELGSRGLTHLLVEPGPTLAASFLRQNLADRVWVSRSPRKLELAGGLSAPEMDLPATGRLSISGDSLTEHLNPASPAFFALEKSADFVLAE